MTAKIVKMVQCPACDGHGIADSSLKTCSECLGTGKIPSTELPSPPSEIRYFRGARITNRNAQTTRK